jgi:hypothetical protein
MKKAICSAIAALTVVPMPVQAQPTSDETTHNIQCSIAVSLLTEKTDPQLKIAGLMGSMFFAGKIFGTNPKIDLPSALQRESPKLDANKMKDLLNECGSEMKLRGEQIKMAGQVLQGHVHAD